jgi:hypothetical protein
MGATTLGIMTLNIMALSVTINNTKTRHSALTPLIIMLLHAAECHSAIKCCLSIFISASIESSLPSLNRLVFVSFKLFHDSLMFAKKWSTLRCSVWKPTHLTSVFSLRTSALSLPDGTTLIALTDVNTDVADVR